MKPKFHILNKILWVIFSFAAITMYSCEPDSDLEIDLSVNHDSLILEKYAGATNVTVYANGNWDVHMVDNITWGSLDRLSDGGNRQFKFSYSENYGAARKIRIALSGDGKQDTIVMVQKGIASPVLSFNQNAMLTNKVGQEIAVGLKTNMPISNLKDFVVAVVYDDASGDNEWISDVRLSTDTVRFMTQANETGIDRAAQITLSFTDGFDKRVKTSLVIDQSVKNYITITFEDLRRMIADDQGEITITNDAVDDIYIDALVISDYRSMNMETNKNMEGKFNKLDFTPNLTTGYIQSEDAKFGLRIRTKTEQDNTFTRFSKVKLAIKDLKLIKESNPTRYTLEGVEAKNVVQAIKGNASALPVKTKYMNALTDDDIYTYVTLRDVEITFSDGAYTNCNDGYQPKTAGVNPNPIFGSDYVDCVPLHLRDIKGTGLYMVTNSKTPWRKNGFQEEGVPRGSGNISGIIVNTKLFRYGSGRNPDQGDIGRYQIRVVEKEDIAIAENITAGFSNTLVEWNWNDKTLTKDDQDNILPDIGTGKLKPTVTLTTLKLDSDYNGKTNKSVDPGKNVSKSALWMTAKWWNFDQNQGEGVDVKFSSAGINKQLSFNIRILIGNGGGSDIYAPVFWEIQYSTDGTQFTTLPDSRFVVHPLVWWSSTLPHFTVPGCHEYSFNLPTSLLGQPEVTVRIKSASTTCVDPTTDDPEGGEITTNTKAQTMRLGTVSVKYNK